MRGSKETTSGQRDPAEHWQGTGTPSSPLTTVWDCMLPIGRVSKETPRVVAGNLLQTSGFTAALLFRIKYVGLRSKFSTHFLKVTLPFETHLGSKEVVHNRSAKVNEPPIHVNK